MTWKNMAHLQKGDLCVFTFYFKWKHRIIVLGNLISVCQVAADHVCAEQDKMSWFALLPSRPLYHPEKRKKEFCFICLFICFQKVPGLCGSGQVTLRTQGQMPPSFSRFMETRGSQMRWNWTTIQTTLKLDRLTNSWYESHASNKFGLALFFGVLESAL